MNPLLAVVLIIGGIILIRYMTRLIVGVPIDAASRAISNGVATRKRRSATVVSTAPGDAVLSALRQVIDETPGVRAQALPGSLHVMVDGSSADVSLARSGVTTTSSDADLGRRIAGLALAAARTLDPAARLG